MILIAIVIVILRNHLFITYKQPFKKYFSTINPNSDVNRALVGLYFCQSVQNDISIGI